MNVPFIGKMVLVNYYFHCLALAKWPWQMWKIFKIELKECVN